MTAATSSLPRVTVWRGWGLSAFLLLLLAAAGPVRAVDLAFRYDGTQYGAKGAETAGWPRYCTTLGIVRQPGKLRPLFLYGRNQSGELKLTFDNMGGLSPYVITPRGSFTILLDRFSVTRALDAPRIAATDWVRADTNREITVIVDQVTALSTADDKDLREILSGTARVSKDRRDAAPTPTLTARVRGRFGPSAKQAPFEADARFTLREDSGFFRLTVEFTVAVRGRDVGLTGADADAQLTTYVTTESFGALPSSHKAPEIKPGKSRGEIPEPGLDLLD